MLSPASPLRLWSSPRRDRIATGRVLDSTEPDPPETSFLMKPIPPPLLPAQPLAMILRANPKPGHESSRSSRSSSRTSAGVRYAVPEHRRLLGDLLATD